MAAARQDAYCSLLMSDAYLPGAMVLAHSLRDNDTKKQLAILVTLDSLETSTIEELRVQAEGFGIIIALAEYSLQRMYDHIIPVDRILNKSPANLYLMNRPDLASTFTKIALWRQTQYTHIVYIDADVVALRAPDELFDSTSAFSASPDIGWPDCFNSGVLSLKPNMGDYYALLALAERGISFDGADQGLLNMHFRDWERLSFQYNCTPSGSYQYVPAYRHFQSSISMLHFIGNNKPWDVGREQKGVGTSGVYEELLGRWWAVYDKHFRTSTTSYYSGQASQQRRTVQRYVKGEALSTDYGFSTIPPLSKELRGPEAPVHTTETSMAEKGEAVEEIDKGEVQPIPTIQARRFSTDWDPIHHAPPINSRPEAANFPTKTYDMSADTTLFQAPKFPNPPKDMYYQVPAMPPAPEKLKPIFPWESTAPKATRVFADDLPPASAPVSQPTHIPETTPSVTTDDDDQTSTLSPATPTNISYQRTNAWDDVPEIERYIANLPQNRRAKVQVLLQNTSLASTANRPSNPSAILSPADEKDNPMQKPQVQEGRRPSMRLTDFPTEIERPSLPVTPAPVRRPSFWGAERDAQGDLPGAEGVPDQSDWDPSARLAELQRRQSEVLAQGPASPTRPIPRREEVASASVPLSEVIEEGGVGEAGLEGEHERVNQSGIRVPNADMPSRFRTVDYSRGQEDLVARGRNIDVGSPIGA